ncbi:MAG: DUF3253 domain-containing protein [Pseudomonadota bacterium]
MTPSRRSVEAEITAQVTARGAGKTICPSEVARALSPTGWRGLMDDVRAAAQELAESGLINVTQRGMPVDLGAARGPVRLGLPPFNGAKAQDTD